MLRGAADWTGPNAVDGELSGRFRIRHTADRPVRAEIRSAREDGGDLEHAVLGHGRLRVGRAVGEG